MTPATDVRLPFFDTYCRIGRRRRRAPDEGYLLEHLQQYRSTYGIPDAAVEHAVAAEASPALGNSLLADEIGGLEGLHPAWHFMPPVSDRIEPTLTGPEPLLEAGVVLSRVDAKEFGDGVPTGYGPLLSILEACRMPLAIDMSGSAGLLGFDVTCFGKWPDIPFIIENVGAYPLHKLMWAMRTFGNVHLSTVGFTLHRGVDFVCDELGPERLIFGSGWPTAPPGMGLGPVLLNGLSAAARRKVAGDNFRTLAAHIGAAADSTEGSES